MTRPTKEALPGSISTRSCSGTSTSTSPTCTAFAKSYMYSTVLPVEIF